MPETLISTGLDLEQAQKDHALCVTLGGAAQSLPEPGGTFKVVCTFTEEQPAPTPTTAPATAIAPTGPFTAAPGAVGPTRAGFIAHMRVKLGAPYIWGKDGPDQFDCSGFAQYALDYLGLDPISDQNSRMLYSHFRDPANGRVLGAFETPKLGDLAFFGAPSSVHHVSVCLDANEVIEAGGGGRTTKTPTPGAEVRVVPLTHRNNLAAIVRPHGVPTW